MLFWAIVLLCFLWLTLALLFLQRGDPLENLPDFVVSVLDVLKLEDGSLMALEGVRGLLLVVGTSAGCGGFCSLWGLLLFS